MKKDKMAVGVLKSLWTGNISMILFYIFLFLLGALVLIGKWTAELWVSLLSKRIQSGQVRHLRELTPIGIMGFVITHAMSYFVFLLTLTKLDPYYPDYSTFCFWVALVFTSLVWIKVVSDVQEFWEEAPNIPLPIEDGVRLPYQDDPEFQNARSKQGLFHHPPEPLSVVQPGTEEVEEDDEWDDMFLNF